jgi:hypothetical protein
LCVCGAVCVSLLSLLGNDSVKTYLEQQRIVGILVLYAVHVVSEDSRRLVLVFPAWEFAAHNHILKLQRLLKNVFLIVGNLPRRTQIPNFRTCMII